MEYRRYSYDRLDGSVRAEERFAAVSRFSLSRCDGDSHPGSSANRHDCEPFVFLLTTRAGGVGLNLVAADTVSVTLFLCLFRSTKNSLKALPTL